MTSERDASVRAKAAADEQLADAVKQRDARIGALEASTRDAATEHAAALAALSATNAAEVARVRDEIGGASNKHAGELSARIAALEAQLEAAKSDATAQRTAHERLLDTVRAEHGSALRQLQETSSKQLVDASVRAGALESELAAAKATATAERERVANEHAAELKRASEQHAAALQRVQAELDAAKASSAAAGEASAKQLADERAAFDAARQQHAAELVRLRDEARAGGDARAAALESELAALRQKTSAELERERAAHAAAIAARDAEATANLTKAAAEHERALAALREQHTADSARAAAALSTDANARVSVLESDVSALRVAAATRQAEHERAIQALNAEHSAQATRAREASAKQASDAAAALAAVEASAAASRAAATKLQSERDQLSATLSEARDSAARAQTASDANAAALAQARAEAQRAAQADEQLRTVRQQLAASESQLAQRSSDLRDAMALLEAADSRLAGAERDTNELASLRNVAAQAQQANAVLDAYATRLQLCQRLVALHTRTVTAQQSGDELRELEVHLATAVANFNTHVATERVRVTTLLTEIDAHETRAQVDLKAVVQLEDSDLGVDSELEQLSSTLAQLKTATTALEPRRVRANEKTQRQRAELAQLEAANARGTEDRREELSAALEQAEEQLESLDGAVDRTAALVAQRDAVTQQMAKNLGTVSSVRAAREQHVIRPIQSLKRVLQQTLADIDAAAGDKQRTLDAVKQATAPATTITGIALEGRVDRAGVDELARDVRAAVDAQSASEWLAASATTADVLKRDSELRTSNGVLRGAIEAFEARFNRITADAIAIVTQRRTGLQQAQAQLSALMARVSTEAAANDADATLRTLAVAEQAVRGDEAQLQTSVTELKQAVRDLRRATQEELAAHAQFKEAQTIQYRAKKGDAIDELVARFLADTDGVYIPPNFKRLDEGNYQFGTKKIRAQILHAGLVVRVGGGFMSFAQFVEKYGKSEFTKIIKLQGGSDTTSRLLRTGGELKTTVAAASTPSSRSTSRSTSRQGSRSTSRTGSPTRK
jgi:hypothetical protein